MSESTLPPETTPVSKGSKRETLLPGFHRNLVWRTFQITLQLLFVIWFRYRAAGKEHLPKDSGALLLMNHQSFLDPVIVGLPLQRPVSFVARHTLFSNPIIGWILKKTYVMPLNRSAAGTESFRMSLDRMKDGFLVGVFPEGTRSKDGKVAPPKPGFIALARRSNVPVIPVGIAGSHKAMPPGKRLIHPARLGVYFGEPLQPELVQELSKKNREQEFLQYVHEEMQKVVEKAAQL